MYDALLKVSSGFKLVYYGLVIVILAVVVAFIGGCVLGAGLAAAGRQGGAAGGQAAAAPPKAGMAAVMGLGLLVGGLAVTGSIVGLVGRFRCMAVPERAGAAKSMIVTSVALELTALLISVVTTADNVGANFLPAQVKLVGSGGSAICSIVAAILFLLFTRSVAEFIRRRGLADTAMSVLWLWVGAVVCYVAGFGVILVGVFAGGQGQQAGAANAGAAGGACAGSVLVLAAVVIALVALVRYARLLIEMSDAVRTYARRNRGGLDELDDDDDYEVEDEDDRPRRRGRRDEDDEEDEDDRPRGRRRDDDDEDEEDKPWKKRW